MKTRFMRFPGGRIKAVTLSYDDGVEQDMHLVEIMRQHGLKGTFNVNAGCFAKESTVHPEGRIHRRMTRSQVLNAYPEDICEVACHGYSHEFMDRCDMAVACNEVLEDRKVFEAMFGKPIHGMAYPFGTHNDQAVAALKATGIWYSRTTVSTEGFKMPTDWLRLPATCHHNNPRLMELADKFLTMTPDEDPKMFYLWGHTYEFDRDNNWDVIESFAEKIGGHDDIWYATNMEIYLACRDYARLESSADGTIIHNPNIRSVWIADRQNKSYEIPAGATIKL